MIIDDLVFLLVSQIFWNVIFPMELHSSIIGLSDKHVSNGVGKEKEHFEGVLTSVINVVVVILNYFFKEIFRNHNPFN